MTDDVGEVVLIYEQVVDETFSAEDGADAEDLTIWRYLETIPEYSSPFHLGLQGGLVREYMTELVCDDKNLKVLNVFWIFVYKRDLTEQGLESGWSC